MPAIGARPERPNEREVTEPVEEDRARMLRLQIEILPARGDESFTVRGFTGTVHMLDTGAGHVRDLRMFGHRYPG
jgi:hypothetical protein